MKGRNVWVSRQVGKGSKGMTLRYRLFSRLGLVEPLVRFQRWADQPARRRS